MSMAVGPKTRIVQLLDLRDFTSHPDGTLTRSHKQVERGEMCYFASPFDLPAYVRFWRRITKQEHGRKGVILADEGVTMELDLYTFGVKVYVKYERPKLRGKRGSVSVIVEDADGFTNLVKYGDGGDDGG